MLRISPENIMFKDKRMPKRMMLFQADGEGGASGEGAGPSGGDGAGSGTGDAGPDSGQGGGGWGTGTGDRAGDDGDAYGWETNTDTPATNENDVALDKTMTPENQKEKNQPGAWDRFTNSFKDVVGKYNSIPKGVTLTAGALVPGSGIAVAAAATLAGVMSALGATPASPEQVAANEKADTDRATNGPGGEMPGILNTNTALVDTPTVATPTVDTPTVDPAQFNARAITSYKGKSYV